MLRVGVVGGGGAEAVVQRLVELGASVAGDGRDELLLDEPGLVLYDVATRPASWLPLMHLVVCVTSLNEGIPTRFNPAGPFADAVIDGAAEPAALIDAVDELWRDRLVPFETNARTSKRAPRTRRPVLTEPRSAWTDDAARLVDRLRAAIGDRAVRVDHIGSTSVPGLRAKDLVDIQVTVEDLSVADEAAEAARKAGFVHVPGEWVGEDRFGVEYPEEVVVDADPARPTNVNFRPVTAPVWREALLFRDWLRAHDDERDAYEAIKQQLADRDGAHVDGYGEAKRPWIRVALAQAETWSTEVGWTP